MSMQRQKFNSNKNAKKKTENEREMLFYILQNIVLINYFYSNK